MGKNMLRMEEERKPTLQGNENGQSGGLNYGSEASVHWCEGPARRNSSALRQHSFLPSFEEAGLWSCGNV